MRRKFLEFPHAYSLTIFSPGNEVDHALDHALAHAHAISHARAYK
jgi:hypothetical protein